MLYVYTERQIQLRHNSAMTLAILFSLKTRMHSSRMRTGRSLTISRSLLPEGGGGCVCFRGVCVCLLLWGVCVSAPRGGLLLRGGVCLWGVCFRSGGVCFWGVCFSGGVCFWRGLLPPLVNRITDTSKNITLATTSLRPVTMQLLDNELQCHSQATPVFNENRITSEVLRR